MLEAFRKGELPVLVNVNVLIQGVDLPDVGASSHRSSQSCRVCTADKQIDLLIDAQPSKKEGHITQKVRQYFILIRPPS